MQYIFLSHDVDWRKQGAPEKHILARKNRFDESVLKNIKNSNPYYNIPEYMEIEEKYNVRSTFFFRTMYENGNYLDYADDMKTLTKGGWEIGLHSDPSSRGSLEKISKEKAMIEKLVGTKIVGNRFHYLGFDDKTSSILQDLGFVYDSTMKKSKDNIVSEDFGHTVIDRLVEFPITLMDAYIFTYMKLSEDEIIPLFVKTLKHGRSINNDFNIITVLWHDNVLKMNGGRMYAKILEFLVSQDDVRICRGIDLAKKVIAG